MPQAFLTTNLDSIDTESLIAAMTDSDARREKVRILVIGSTYGIERVIHELYRVGFAEVGEWSQPQPTGRAHEMMRVLTRYVIVE